MTKVKSLDAKLLFDAGQVIAGIRTFNTPSDSTQPTDIVDDCREVINERYTPERISAFLSALKEYGLKEEAKELKEEYKQLREQARLYPVKL